MPDEQIDTAGAVAAYLNPVQDQPARAARASMEVAAGANPEFEAELRRASARTGVPLDSARAYPDDVKRQAALAAHDFDALARQFPGTTAFLANPDNARIAHDDLANLSSTESTIGPITGPKPTFLTYAAGLMKSLPQGAGMAKEGIRMQLADLFGFDAVRDDAMSNYRRLSLEQRVASPAFDSSTASGVYSGLTSTIRAVPGLVASIATRSTVPMLATMGLQTEADSYGKYRTRGASADQAWIGGLVDGTTEVATEMLPMGFLVKNMGRAGAGTFLTGLLAREIPGEQIATVVQDAVDTAIANPDKTWGDYLKERPDAAYQTLVATMTQAGLMEGANVALQRVQGRSQEAQHAGQVGEALSQFNALAEASKVRERDTGTAQAFFQSLMQEGRQDVWITPQALAESGMLDQVAQALPGVAAQLEEAATTGADVRIPVADLMATLAGPELAQSIIPHLSDEPGGFTQTTANEYLQSGAAQELADEVARTLADKQHDDAFAASREAVTANFQAQLDAAGRFAPTVNQAYATMVGNFYAVQAARMGITPEEMAQRYPLQVKAESMPGVRTLDQAPAPENIIDLNIGEIRRKNGAIGTQGVTESQVRGVLEHAAGLTVPENATMREMVDALKADDAAQARLRAFMEQNPLQAYELPDGSIQITDAHHRAFLLNQLGDATIPAQVNDYTGLSERRTNQLNQSGRTIEVDGVRRPITNSRGQLVGQTFAEQQAFWAWFGDSKAVDAQGRPLVAYHATQKEFDTFDRSAESVFDYGDNPDSGGIFFESSADMANYYASGSSKNGGRMIPAYLRITNPAQIKQGLPFEEQAKQLHEAEKAGHDGAFIGTVGDNEFVVFTPEQAKSAIGNDGTFDATDPNILSQQDEDTRRGMMSFGDDITAQPTVITLLQNADLSTFLHESGHFFLEVLNDMASRPDAPSDIADDMAAILGWFGIGSTPAVKPGFVRFYHGGEAPDGGARFLTEQRTYAEGYARKAGNTAKTYYVDIREDSPVLAAVGKAFDDSGTGQRAPYNHFDAPPEIAKDLKELVEGTDALATWNAMDLEAKRPHHEAFARGFEAYLFEGRAPTSDLQGLFSRFRSWLVNVYKSLTALQVDLSPEVRGVFDRMLASTEAVAQAEREAGFAGMFGTKPAFMTDEEWAAYRALSIEATEGAVRELETRSLKDMQWLANAKSKVLAGLQREAAEKRKAIRAEVTAEVMAEPVNVARNFFRRGLYPDGSTADLHKLSIASLIEMYGGEGDKFARLNWEPLGYGKYGALAKDGISPDMAAESLGFDSGEALVDALLNEPLAKDKIGALTDQRMLERHGDLVNEEAIDRAVNEAVHSAAHIRFIATEMNALAKAAGRPAVLAKAAKLYAEQIVARTPINQLRPDRYTAAATRAAKAADKAFKKGDIQAAAAEKQAQLINAYAATAALNARAEVEKTMTRFKTITNGNNEKVAKTRDLDMVMATRAILAEYGVGTRGAKATEYLAKVEAYDPAMAAVLRERIDAATENAKPIKELTIEQLGALRDEVESLWFLAKRSRQMEVDGDLLDRQDIQDQLVARLEEIGVPADVPGDKHAITPGEVALSRLQSLRAALRRVEAWAGAKDGSEAMGPFRKFIWNTIKDRADAYRVDKAKYLKAYRTLLDTVAPTLSQVKIAAPELNYTFGFDKGGMGKVELLHAILHTGNAGNKKKLLLGRRWAREAPDGSLDTSRWDAFVARMVKEGTLTRADFDFAQGVWDLLEEMKPAAQKAHREVFGRYFDEVTADPFKVTLGGVDVDYRGGYVPAIADSRIVSDAKTRAIMEEESATLMSALPSTSKGFTKSRVEYNHPLLLDLRLLAGHIDKVLLFSHLEQPVRDVRRVLGHSSVAKPLGRIDPAAYDGLLIPWLNRTARQQVETQVDGSNGLMRFFSVVRQRAGMAAMFANVSNTAQQITGFSLAALRVKPSHLMGAAADFIRSPKAMAQAVAEASPYMANRMGNEVAAMTGAINDILLNPGVYEKAVGWTTKHTYFMQSAMDNVMGPIIWHGAYNQAIETAPAGLTDDGLKRYARQLADSAVRETQGSTLPEDISRIETGNAFVRLFTQFAGYFNMQANLLGTEFSKVAQDTGLRKGLGRGFYILLFGFLMPAWAAQAIALAFRGGPDDEDKDGSYLDDWLASTFGWGTLRAGTALVPVVGQTANALANTFNGKPYDDRISTGPAISMIESAVSVPSDVYKLALGEGSGTKTVRDVATLVSLTLGLPANAVARPIVYATEVASGKAKPTGPIDVGRGLVTGAASPASKGR